MAKRVIDSPAKELDKSPVPSHPSDSGCTYADGDSVGFPLVIGVKIGDEGQDYLNDLLGD